ncbi:uncharacterized protein LOC144872828 [Branchiostoma floridae x Branchiostoma japonicum]
MFKVFITVLVISHTPRTVSDCTNSYFVPDPEFVGCFQNSSSEADPYLSHEIPTTVYTATDCVSCCATENQNFNFAGVVTNPDFVPRINCTCGQRNEQYYDSISEQGGCLDCPGNSNQSCGHWARVSVYRVPLFNLTTTQSTQVSSFETTRLTTRTSESSTSLTTNNMGTLGENTALIAGSAGGGAAVLLTICGVIAFCIVRKRSSAPKKNTSHSAAINLHEVGAGTGDVRNSSRQPNDANVDALYAKPDKKRRNQPKQPKYTADPDDPSYQDVMPTGAHHQYATVQDERHPYTAVRDEPNLYDSIQDDQQYATVQKGRKLDPNAETDPLYGKGSVDNTTYDPGSLSNDKDRVPSVCEMVDNVIYG